MSLPLDENTPKINNDVSETSHSNVQFENLLKIINTSSTSKVEITEKDKDGKQQKKIKIETNLEVPRGLPKSGRVWKGKKQKFSTTKKSIFKRSFEKKEALRAELRHVKEVSRAIKDEKKQEKELRKQRQQENEKRKLENQRKAEIVQIIKNPAKLKRIRKKQLRMIEKRDLDSLKVV